MCDVLQTSARHDALHNPNYPGNLHPMSNSKYLEQASDAYYFDTDLRDATSHNLAIRMTRGYNIFNHMYAF